jgi:type IV pilus assembly protein PilA
VLDALRKRLRHDEEQGFTLIELMVVVLIIAILIAIAIPTFLGARSRAQDRAAQSDIRNVLTAEKTNYTDNQTYTEDLTVLSNIEPNVATHVSDPTAGVVPQLSTDNKIVCLTKKSASGSTFFATWESAAAGTYYGKTDLSASCPTSAPAGYSKTGWS